MDPSSAKNPFRFGKARVNFGRMLCRPVTPAWGDWTRVLSVEEVRKAKELAEEGGGKLE